MAKTLDAVAPDLERLAAYREARQRGVNWVLGHLNRDGSLGDPRTGFSYYRAPWTFTATGETEAAAAVCEWIRRNLVTADGRIDGPLRVFDEWATYRDATLVVGAHMAGQYDLSHGLWPGIMEIRDPGSGIFPNDRLPGGGMSDSLDVTGGGPGCGFRGPGRRGHGDGARNRRASSLASGTRNRRCLNASITPGRDRGRRSSRSRTPSSWPPSWSSTTSSTRRSTGSGAGSARRSWAACGSPIRDPSTSTSPAATRRTQWNRRTRSSAIRRRARARGAARSSTRSPARSSTGRTRIAWATGTSTGGTRRLVASPRGELARGRHRGHARVRHAPRHAHRGPRVAGRRPERLNPAITHQLVAHAGTIVWAVSPENGDTGG